MITLKGDILNDFEAASSREWLETNGIGGYASSTASGANTRRYHGLLIAATRPPLGRVILLSKFEESLIIDGERYDLSCNQYPGAVHPEGFKFLTNFRLDPFPIWTYEVSGVEIEKSVVMPHGENTTVCRWRINKPQISKSKFQIELRPLIAFRDHHHLRHADAAFDGAYEARENQVSIQPLADMPRLYFAHNGAKVEPNGTWYHNFEYAIERERGFEFHEDLFQPFSLRFDLAEDAVVIASTAPKAIEDAQEIERAEVERRAELVERVGTTDDFRSQLVLAADQFIVDRGSGKTVIAGYPWFSDWGRDTMISLPGLTLSTNRPEIAKNILREFSRHISEGMLPNRFPDEGDTPEYNNVDGTLWFFEAIRAYVEHTHDYEFVRDELYDKLVNIIDWHLSGTRYNIHVDTDGLLYAGEEGKQLTWMDAKIGDWVVTPRIGKPVEIQALWYNALMIMADFAASLGREANYDSMAEIARESFNGQFWNEDAGCLCDVINGDTKDASIRPNQILAVSLHYSMMAPDLARQVVEKVETELVTPYGLRSLSPKDPRYVNRYAGPPMQRDSSYHQGTVWAWLIGPFIDAWRRVHPDDRDNAEHFTNAFRHHLNEAMLGQVSEIFDAGPPFPPRGCGAQAWSVAELLTIL